MMAWIGMRPLAISCPPAWRTAEANGAAQRFSKISDTGDAAGVHGGREVEDVLLGQGLGELRLDAR